MTTPLSSGTPEKVFSLIHVDRSLLVANKPTRLLSVPGRGPDKQDCLVSRIQTEFPDALIVHRLDYDTSGLIVLARGKTMHRELSILFQERQVTKRYVAIVDGKPDADSGEVSLPLELPIWVTKTPLTIEDMNKIAAAGWAGELPDPDREGKT